MSFNSMIFIFYFIPIVLFLFWLIKDSYKKVLLIIVSYIFYSWGDVTHLFILIIVSFMNFAIAKLMFNSEKRKKQLLVSIIIFNVAILFFYKYLNFSIMSLNSVLNLGLTSDNIGVPLGLSFFIFSSISYVVDIYRNKSLKPQFINSVLYIAFFPKLISGPIVTYNAFICQIETLGLTIDGCSKGVERFIIGLSKKVIIADILGNVATDIFDSFSYGIDTPTAWIGALCYTMQIYYDFSGYSDMAIGISSIFGISIRENFNFPYLSKSITEFWRRWHMSLGEWFREYIYIPLGGNRKHVSFNLFIVFLLTGVWHGSRFAFFVWGVGYGILIIVEKRIMKFHWYRKIPKFVKIFVTFNIVNLGWVLFKLQSVTTSINYILQMFGLNNTTSDVLFEWSFFATNRTIITLILSFIGAFFLNKKSFQNFVYQDSHRIMYIIKLLGLIMLFGISIIYIANSTYNPFIYFQF